MVLSLASCGVLAPGMVDPPSRAANLVDGPPIETITTPFDRALMCLSGKIDSALTFGVGQIADSTGKETFSEGGTGKFISQGAGEIVQSALFKTGVTVANRRDPNIAINETNWGLREIDTFLPSTFYITGSINSLDFIPGGGAAVNVNGVGPRARQDRILVGLDLALTDTYTGIVVANVSLQKQIYAREVAFGVDTFFGTDLISFEIGMKEREALHLALRQMINLAVLQLLKPVAGPRNLEKCVSQLGDFGRSLSSEEGYFPNPRLVEVIAMAGERTRTLSLEEAAAPPPAATQAPPVQMSAAAIDLGRQATILAARAISAAERSVMTNDPDAADLAVAESADALSKAVRALRNGAAEGLTGPEGDGAALIVEQAVTALQKARDRAVLLRAEAEKIETESGAVPDGAASTSGPPRPGTPEYDQRGGG